MQKTIECNGLGHPSYPEHITPKEVTVYIHDSGMIATHDYSCPCCRENSAVLDLSTGLMQPCRKCQRKGYRIIKRSERKWWHIFNTPQEDK